MSLKNFIIYLKLVIVVLFLLNACASNDTQKKVSTQLTGITVTKEVSKNLSKDASNIKSKNIEKTNQNNNILLTNSLFDEYVNSLLNSNKSKDFPDINNIPD